jgi:hypothetical protein
MNPRFALNFAIFRSHLPYDVTRRVTCVFLLPPALVPTSREVTS